MFKIITAFVSGLVISSGLILYAIPRIIQPNPNFLIKNSNEPLEQYSVGIPVRLKIPKLNINSLFEYVGLTAEGAMDIPKSPDGVAWFAPGRRPGEVGSAVVAGHFGWKDGKEAVFDNLHELVKGDMVFVEDERGDTLAFRVRESRSYDPSADATAVFGMTDGKSHLNLVTCEGVWSAVSHSYAKRLVVFTDRVE